MGRLTDRATSRPTDPKARRLFCTRLSARGAGQSPVPAPGSPFPPLPSCTAPAAHSQAGTSSRKRAFCARSRCRSCRTMWRFQRAFGTPRGPDPAIAAVPPAPRASPKEGGATGAGPLGDSVTSAGGRGGDSSDRAKSVRRGWRWGWDGGCGGGRGGGVEKAAQMCWESRPRAAPEVLTYVRRRDPGRRSRPPGQLPPRPCARSRPAARSVPLTPRRRDRVRK